jgi:ABC-type glycerol-3-phosphate transport system substrate-binding protein
MNQMQRIVSRRKLGSISLTGAALAACGSPAQQGTVSTGKPPSGPPVPIEWVAALNPLQLSTAQTMLVDAVQQAHPNIRLSITNTSPTVNNLATLLAAGTPPDVVYRGGGLRFFLAKMWQDVTQRVKADKYNTATFAKEPFETSCMWRGSIACLPVHYGGNWPVMPYNRDLFREAGVPEPTAKWGDPAWDADAWLRALQRTTRPGPNGKPATFGINQPNISLITGYWTGLWKASWISDDYKTITSDSPQTVEAFEYLVSLMTRHRVMASDAQLQENFGDANPAKAFLAGKLAMTHTRGGDTLAPIGQAVREQGAPFAFAPLPTFKHFGGLHTFEHNGLVVGAKHPDEGWTLMKWVADTPNWAASRGNLPARAENFDAWAQAHYKGVESKVRLDVYRDAMRNTVRQDKYNVLPTSEQMASEIIAPAFDRLWAGDTSVATTLREIKGPMQALVPKEL